MRLTDVWLANTHFSTNATRNGKCINRLDGKSDLHGVGKGETSFSIYGKSYIFADAAGVCVGGERQPKESARTRDAFPRKTLHTGDDRKNSTDTIKAMLCIAVVRALFSTLPVLVVRPEYIEL